MDGARKERKGLNPRGEASRRKKKVHLDYIRAVKKFNRNFHGAWDKQAGPLNVAFASEK
jgi:hypothetical protein